MSEEPINKRQRLNTLDQLKSLSMVVADTGEVHAINKYCPQGNYLIICFY